MDWERFVNEPADVATTPQFNLQRGDRNVGRLAMQPHLQSPHRAADMPRKLRLPAVIAACLAFVFTISGSANAQPAAAAAPATTSTVSTTMRPALSQVVQTLNSLNIRKWKAPNPVRDEATSNVAAIQRDINGTLATLLQQADASPTSVPAAFAVYRNIDALYDTLLRVVETAELAAPDNESNQLEATLKTLEGARANLGDAILTGTQNDQAEVARLRAALASAAASPQQHTTHTTVVDDGPAPAKTHHRTTTPRNKSTKAASPSDKAQSPAKPQQ